MAHDLFQHEFSEELRRVAMMWGATSVETAPKREPQAHWTARLSGVSVTLGLKGVFHLQDSYLIPEIRVGSSGGLPVDAALALVVAEDVVTTLRAAVSAYAMLQGTRIWMTHKPCGACSATGKERGGSCSTCAGTGKLPCPPIEPTPPF